MVAPAPLEFTHHAKDAIAERGLPIEWIYSAWNAPDRIEEHPDGTRHYLKRIVLADNRVLRLVVNPQPRPTVVTAFLDRRLKELLR